MFIKKRNLHIKIRTLSYIAGVKKSFSYNVTHAYINISDYNAVKKREP